MCDDEKMAGRKAVQPSPQYVPYAIRSSAFAWNKSTGNAVTGLSCRFLDKMKRPTEKKKKKTMPTERKNKTLIYKLIGDSHPAFTPKLTEYPVS